MGNERWRVTQITALDGIGACEIVLTGKIKRIFESTATVNSGAVLAILREICVELSAIHNIQVDKYAVGTASTSRYQNGLSRLRAIEVGKCYHIFIHCGIQP